MTTQRYDDTSIVSEAELYTAVTKLTVVPDLPDLLDDTPYQKPKLSQPDNKHWQEDGECNKYNPDLFYPERPGKKTSYDAARKICDGCPVKDICLDYAMEMEDNAYASRHGMFGGLTPQERQRLAKRNNGMKGS